MAERTRSSHGEDRKHLVIGVDFGTSAARAVVIDALSGEEAASASASYPRFEKGLYCDPTQAVYRQHPRDHLEALQECVSGAVGMLSNTEAAAIEALTIDTTGSTPAPVSADGNPLAFDEYFADGGRRRPGAMDGRIELYEGVQMLALAVDQALTQPFGLHLAADVTDRALREAFIDAWIAWNREFTDMQVPVFEAVARTVSDRIEAADGSPRDRVIHGLAIQEPLVRDADTSVITHRDPIGGPGDPGGIP